MKTFECRFIFLMNIFNQKYVINGLFYFALCIGRDTREYRKNVRNIIFFIFSGFLYRYRI